MIAMNYKLIILLFILYGTTLAGQDKVSFSLNEAQDYAIEHNKTLQNARNDIALSERKIKETISQGLPQVDASVDWMTYFGYEMEFNFNMDGGAPDFTVEQIQEATTQTLGQFAGMPAMGLNPVTPQDIYNYQAGSYFESQLTAMMPATTIKMTDASTAKLQIGQLIFSGQYWVGIKVAKLGKVIAEQGLENSVLDIKEAVANSYTMALITAQTIETFKQSIDNLNEIKMHTGKMFEAGMAEQTDVDQLSIQVNMLENNLRSMNRSLKMLHNMIKFQMGIDYSVELELSDKLDNVMAQMNPTAPVGEFDIALNPMFQLTQTQIEITEKMVDMEKMAYAPTITGFYAYNQKLLTTGFDMTPNNLAGVTMNVPVFQSGTRKHKVAQAQIELDKAQLSQSMLKDQLQLQFQQLVFDLNNAIENYEAQKENVDIAKRVFNNIKNKYEQGVASSLDLTQSNSNYLQAESNYIQSMMSLMQARLAIDKLNNQL